MTSKHNLRSWLTSRLLTDRQMPRYIIAPNGYGKSSVAFEYAQLAFEFKHVFWIRCSSPCFIRDLDKGDISRLILESDSEAKLAVFDDVPRLDPARSDMFSNEIERLNLEGCETICCCLPSTDSQSSMIADSSRLLAHDLLLSYEECDSIGGIQEYTDVDSHGFQWRTPSYAWGKGGPNKILEGLMQEELPSSIKNAIFFILVLGEGELCDLSSLLGNSSDVEDLCLLGEMYPYLGIDRENGTFQSMEVRIIDIPKGLCMESGMTRSSNSKRFSDLADALLDSGRCDRCSELIRRFGRSGSRRRWMEDNGWRMVFSSEPLSYMRLVESMISKKVKVGPNAFVIAAWGSYILGDVERAYSYCKKACRSNAVGWRDSAACDMMLLMLGDESAKANADALRPGRMPEILSEDDRCSTSSDASPVEWGLACKLQESIDSEADFMDAWDAHAHEVAAGSADRREMRSLALCGALFVNGLMSHEGDIDSDAGKWEAIAVITQYCVRHVESRKEGGLEWPEYFAGKMVEEVIKLHPMRLTAKLAPADCVAVRNMDRCLIEQAGEWAEVRDSSINRRKEYEITHENPYRKENPTPKEVIAMRASTPTLFVSLFGGLTCYVGDRKEDAREIARDKAKCVLAILALSQGHEVSREQLVASLWPDSSFESANKNLYVVWSYLKSRLMVGENSPYLVRTQNGFHLDERYVATDLSDHEETCRALMFGRDDLMSWEQTYQKVTGPFARELLPNINGIPGIDMARRRYRDQMVDALVAASHRLYEKGEPMGAIWYAREAKMRDPSREDVYIALMQAQIASDQRSCALDTYFECRKYLTEHMGIDPSRKVMELYNSVIQEEEVF